MTAPLATGAPVLAVVPNGPAVRGTVAACSEGAWGRQYWVAFAQGGCLFCDHLVHPLAGLGDRPAHAFAAGGTA